jgi:hypothetical protein
MRFSVLLIALIIGTLLVVNTVTVRAESESESESEAEYDSGSESDELASELDTENEFDSEIDADSDASADADVHADATINAELEAILSAVTGASANAEDDDKIEAQIGKDEPKCPGVKNTQTLDASEWSEPLTGASSDYTLCLKAVWKCGVLYGHCMRTCVGRADNYTIPQCKSNVQNRLKLIH